MITVPVHLEMLPLPGPRAGLSSANSAKACLTQNAIAGRNSRAAGCLPSSMRNAPLVARPKGRSALVCARSALCLVVGGAMADSPVRLLQLAAFGYAARGYRGDDLLSAPVVRRYEQPRRHGVECRGRRLVESPGRDEREGQVEPGGRGPSRARP